VATGHDGWRGTNWPLEHGGRAIGDLTGVEMLSKDFSFDILDFPGWGIAVGTAKAETAFSIRAIKPDHGLFEGSGLTSRQALRRGHLQ
jgi:hypothetical protein